LVSGFVALSQSAKQNLSEIGGEDQVTLGLTTSSAEWNKTYGGTGDDHAYSLVQTSDGGYAIAGYTESRLYEYLTDFWLVKTDVILGYHVTIKAYCNPEGMEVNVWIKMDGFATPYETPHTFTDLTYTHTFAVPIIDANGDHFTQWNTGETNLVITVLLLDRTYTAYYERRPPLAEGGSGGQSLERPKIADF